MTVSRYDLGNTMEVLEEVLRSMEMRQPTTEQGRLECVAMWRTIKVLRSMQLAPTPEMEKAEARRDEIREGVV